MIKINFEILKEGDILNFKTAGIGGFLIRYGTNGNVNHSALFIDKKNNEIIEALGSGIKRNNLEKVLKNKNILNLDILRYENLTAKELECIKIYAQSRVGKKYDYRQIIGLSIRNLFKKFTTIKFWWNKNLLDSKDKDICSELVYNAYQSIQIKLLDKKNEGLIVPCDFEKSPYLTKINY